jgi:hydrogenase-4 component H
MNRLRSIFYLFPQLWRTLLRRPSTVRYPFAPLELPPYFRGRIVIEPDACRGCGACVRDCPASGLELQRKGHRGFQLIHYPDRCAYCGQCEASCPTGAIRQDNDFVPAASERASFVEVLVQRDLAPPMQDED